ncbi:hypothetical protein C2G38_2173315 [Gigaspora rosea]|uniref:Uncharacterized protein n=1 Tax=Gigaspora rosea TaxID=44941 RepID=A0A397VJM8_9GLOM|nr:hypothetical protein C2G38_2173315 [Gigaspora rosea]
MSAVDKAVYDRKIKKTTTSVTEEEDLNAIWRTCCSNKENEELSQTVVKDSGDMVNTMSRSGLQEDMTLNREEKAEQAMPAEGKNRFIYISDVNWLETGFKLEFKNVMIIDSPTADLATPSMEVDKEVKVEDQTASVAETFALSSEEIKVEINPISIEVDISQKSAIEDPLASFYTKDSSTKEYKEEKAECKIEQGACALQVKRKYMVEEVEEESATKMAKKSKTTHSTNKTHPRVSKENQQPTRMDKAKTTNELVLTTDKNLETLVLNKELSWGKKVEQEIEALKNAMNILSNTQNKFTKTCLPLTLLNSTTTTQTSLTDENIKPGNSQMTANEIVSKTPITQDRKWTSFFPHLRRGQLIYSTFFPRNSIKMKNDFALIIDISNILTLFNEIMISLFDAIKYNINAANQHLTKGKYMHLEVTFIDSEKQKFYAANGLTILNRTYFGYIPIDERKSFLPVKWRNIPLGNKNEISDALLKAFKGVGPIAAIKPLLIEGIPYLMDQWIVIFETTNDPNLEQNIPGLLT